MVSSDNWVRIPAVAGFVDFLCGANIVGNIISAEKICNYPGRSRVTRLVQYMDNDCETLVSTRIRDRVLSRRSRIVSRVCIKSTSLYTNNGCTAGIYRKGDTMGDVVCG